jgi:hypothetical protein
MANKNPSNDDYYPFPESTIRDEAKKIQQRVNNLKINGIPVNTERVWAWLTEARPDWPELERQKVLQRVRL